MDNINSAVSRRRFVKKVGVLFGVVAGSTVLAACGDDTATAVPAATNTAITVVTPTVTAPATTKSVTSKTTAPATNTVGNSNTSVTAAASNDPNFADLGAVAAFDSATSSPKPFTLNPPKNGDQESGFVVKVNGQYLALSDICTHQGCEVGWVATDNQFECPCHGSRYNLQGQNTSGPAPRPLNHFQTKVVNGRLLVSYKNTKTES